MEFYLLGRLANQDSNENFFNYVKKVSYFWGFFFSYFHGQNKCKIQLFVDYSVRTKKYLNLKKNGSKLYFLVRSTIKSRLNFKIQDCLSKLRVEVGEKTNAHWGSYNGNKHSKSFLLSLQASMHIWKFFLGKIKCSHKNSYIKGSKTGKSSCKNLYPKQKMFHTVTWS